MGVVYLARDPLLERTVAIKVLSVFNSELRERFSREARSAAALNHHNIVTVYDVGEDQGRPFIAMEYVDGETLGDLIRRRPPLGVVRKLDVMLELCAGLAYAHRSGVVHRDIKPANVMVASSGAIKILDFGLARLSAEISNAGLTRAGSVLGTPHYMSPEQIEGNQADERSDIFAVGLVLYELLGYRKAYSGDSAHVVLHKIVSSNPEPLSSICEGLDQDLEAIVGRAIEKVPEQRYQRLSTLMDDLKIVRERLNEEADEPTVLLEHPGTGGSKPKSQSSAAGSGSRTPSHSPRHMPNADLIARRRAAQIEQHLADAARYFEAREFDAAIEQCELAAVLDPDNARVLEMHDAVHAAVEQRQIDAWVEAAEAHLGRGALSEAGLLIEQSLRLRPDSPEAQRLKHQVAEARREREGARERERAVTAAVSRARSSLSQGALDAAARAVGQALEHDAGNAEAQALSRQIVDARAERQREEQLTREAEAERLRRETEQRREAERVVRNAEAERLRLQNERQQQVAEQRRLAEEEAARAAAEQGARDEVLRVEAERAERERETVRREEASRAARVAAASAVKHASREEQRQARFGESLESLEHTRGEFGSDLDVVAVVASAREGQTKAEQATGTDEEADRSIAVVGHLETAGSASPRRRGILIAGTVSLGLAGLLAGWWFVSPPSRDEAALPPVARTTPTPAAQQYPIAINAVPWATVRILVVNSQTATAERTTPFRITLPAGQYRLEFANPAFDSVSELLTVGPDGTPSINVVMPGVDVDRLVAEVLGAQPGAQGR